MDSLAESLPCQPLPCLGSVGLDYRLELPSWAKQRNHVKQCLESSCVGTCLFVCLEPWHLSSMCKNSSPPVIPLPAMRCITGEHGSESRPRRLARRSVAGQARLVHCFCVSCARVPLLGRLQAFAGTCRLHAAPAPAGARSSVRRRVVLPWFGALQVPAGVC